MEAKKSLDLQSMGWRMRTIVHMQWSKNRGADGINLNLSPKAWETGIPTYEARRRWKSSLRKRVCSSSTFFLIYSGSQQIGWCPPPWGGPLASLSSPVQLLISSGDTHKHIQIKCLTSYLGIPVSPVKLGHKINHHNLTAWNLNSWLCFLPLKIQMPVRN